MKTGQLAQLARIALFPALLAILAQIVIPLPFTPVPLTGQFIGIFLAPVIFGTRGAVLAVLSHLLLGAAGAPVFSMARGGLGMILGPAGATCWACPPGVYLAVCCSRTPLPRMLRTSAQWAYAGPAPTLPAACSLNWLWVTTLPGAAGGRAALPAPGSGQDSPCRSPEHQA